MTDRHLSAAGRDAPVHIEPADAGWAWTGLSVLTLAAGDERRIVTGDTEVIVLPLTGSLRVSVDSPGSPDQAMFELRGRDSVFTRVSDFGYVGRDSTVTLATDHGCQVALPSSRCTRQLPPAYGAAEDVPVEIRGAGSATRQVNNFAVPGVWDHADKLICCEVLTPAGNWSSFPPHKHDLSRPCAVANEEIYLYRIAGADQVTPDRSAIGYHRTYTGLEHEAAGLSRIDDLFEVRDLDAVLVPHGFHGPSIAAPGYPMYYLNVMAGPGDERAMSFCDDPVHTWARGAWADEPVDARCPLTTSSGRVARGAEPTPDGG